MKEISNVIVSWYQQHKRDLPWRKDKDPYHVWVSEIMLQQTRIEAVKDYYMRFMEALPTIEDLANVSEDYLLKLWEGLGYYNRARNLQKAAKKIVQDNQGIFPDTYEEMLALPGIGEYTAGAIASICFDRKCVAIDGNVLRVFMRLTNCSDNILEERVRKRVKEQLLEIVPEKTGDFNEGLMELGETICLPTTLPNCSICPLTRYCKSYHQNTMTILPVRIKETKKTTEDITVLLFQCQDKIALSYRKEQSLLKNMWEFPNLCGNYSQQKLQKLLASYPLAGKIVQGPLHKHVFTHKIWQMTSYFIPVQTQVANYTWVSIEEALNTYAIPMAFQPFLKALKAKQQPKEMKKQIIHPLKPIYNTQSQVLLLGSLPSIKSREEKFYYAHPQNRFWKVLASVLQEEVPTTKQEKTAMLLTHQLALWDVIHSCSIIGSSDASITDVKVNHLQEILKHSKIKYIFTTGKTAKKYYDKYCFKETGIEAINLPSTSPANAAYTLEKLIEAYQQIINVKN